MSGDQNIRCNLEERNGRQKMLKGIYSEFIKVKLLPCGRITLNVKKKKKFTLAPGSGIFSPHSKYYGCCFEWRIAFKPRTTAQLPYLHFP